MAKKKLQSGQPAKKKRGDAPSEAASEELSRWKIRVARAQQLRKDWETKFRLPELERTYLGVGTTGVDEGLIKVNRFLSTIEAIQPNLFLNEPKFFVRPLPGQDRQPVADRHAAIGEGLLDAVARQDGNLKGAITLALLQSFFRAGVIKTCYEPKMEPNPQAGQPLMETDSYGNPIMDPTTAEPVLNPETGEPLVDPETKQPIIDPASVKPRQMRDRDGNPMFEEAEAVTDEAYRFEWVNAKNMLLPDEGPDTSRWTWIGEEIVVPLEEAKKDERFKEGLREKLKPNESLMSNGEEPKVPPGIFEPGAKSELERLRYFECYDISKKRLIIWADGQDFNEFLLEDSIPNGVEDHPYALLSFLPIIAPEPSPWPLPYTFNWLDQQREYDIRRTQMTEGAKRSARKIYYDDNTFPEADEAQKSLQSSRDMEAVKITDVTRPPVVAPDPSLPPDILRDTALLQNDWLMITGQTGARLSAPGGEKTATEATFLERSSNLRDAKLQDKVNDWLGEAGQKMLQRLKATLTLDYWSKLRGFSDSEFDDYVKLVYGSRAPLIKYLPGIRDSFKENFGKEEWVKVSRDMIQFEADVSVAPGSSRPRNLDVERRQWIEFLTLIGQFPQLALSRELLRETASKFEFVSERMLDELVALAQKMVEINANQAGRNQGGKGEEGNGAAGGGPMGDLLGMLTGPAVRGAA